MGGWGRLGRLRGIWTQLGAAGGGGWLWGSAGLCWALLGSGLWALGAGLGSSGFETEIDLLENGEVVSCAVGLGWARSSEFETEIGLLENGEVVSRPEKKVSRWPTATSNFYLFLS